MPQQSTARQDLTPEDFAKQLGGTVGEPVAAPTAATATDPDAFARALGGRPELPSDAFSSAIAVSNTGWDQFWRSAYAAIPEVTGMIGGAVGALGGGAAGAAAGTVALPGVGTVGGGATGAFLGAETGAGVGGMVGRGIQAGIDTFFDRPEQLQNPRGVGEEATRQMTFEGVGRIFSGLMGRFSGRLAPQSQEVADRLATSKAYDLKLSPGEITNDPAIRRVEYLAQRGIGGYARQKAAQKRTDEAAQKAIGSILDTVGPVGSETGAGAAVQETVQASAARGGRRLEGAVSANLSPRTGLGAAGDIAEQGVRTGRTAFARQADAYGQMVKDAPPVDVTPMHKEAWRIFNDDIMPALIENPALGPKTAEWQKVVRMYQSASKNGSRFELSEATRKALSDAALEKAPYGPLRVINQVLATPTEMSFQGALKLRGTLRDAGKGQELLAGDAAEALATYFDTGSATSAWRGIRGILNETHAPYEAAAAAYNTNRQLFKTTFIEKVADRNPESVLSTLTTAEGRYNASRIRDLSRVLQDLPKTYGTEPEIESARKAWDTVRAEWFRREVVQDNVFGLADRMRKIDPDVLQAWFPDLAGKSVVKQAQVTGQAFESQLLLQMAEADPSKIVGMIGSSPAHVNEFIARINALPGPVAKQPVIDRVRRAWTEATLTSGDPSKLMDRINKADPDILKAWFSTPGQQAALTNLKQIGNALSTRRPVEGMGAYESLGAVTVVGNLMMGNLGGALKTALGFEGIPAFMSWAMYNPRMQQYLFDASDARATVTSRTAGFLRMVGAYQASTEVPRDVNQPVGATP